MYWFVLLLHSYLRWAVLILGIVAVVKAIAGWRSRKPWEGADNRIGMLYVTSLDVQLLIGLILYIFLSPISKTIFVDPKTAMATSGIRFFSMEHQVLMLVGIALAHVGRVKVRKLQDATARHKTAAIWFGLSMLAILAAIPWPMLSYGRPLLR